MLEAASHKWLVLRCVRCVRRARCVCVRLSTLSTLFSLVWFFPAVTAHVGIPNACAGMRFDSISSRDDILPAYTQYHITGLQILVSCEIEQRSGGRFCYRANSWRLVRPSLIAEKYRRHIVNYFKT